MVHRLENSVALRIGRGCMQEVRTSPVAPWISIGPKLCVVHGDGQCCAAGDAVSEFIPKFVYPGPQLVRRKFEGGVDSSMALWSCLDGFTAAVTILGVNPVNLLPKCLPVCSTSQTRSGANLPWHMIARNGFQLWTYVPRIMEFRANRVLFI